MAADKVAEKKVAFITGVARGQGRAHAVKLAAKGMNIVGLDICADIPSMDYPNATEDDLLTTVKLVEAAGGGIAAAQGDARSYDDLRRVLALGLDRFGRVDVRWLAGPRWTRPSSWPRRRPRRGAAGHRNGAVTC